MKQRIYLDHNASSPLRPEAREAMLRVMDMRGNPSSIHAEGRTLKGEIERGRRSVANLVGAQPNQVFFTSGATEAANWALRPAWDHRNHLQFVPLASEHPCVFHEESDESAVIPIDRRGVGEFAAWSASHSLWKTQFPSAGEGVGYFVAVQRANSETGVIQPWSAVVDSIVSDRCTLVCDAVQAAGRVSVEIGALQCEALLLSAHKLGGPAGIGALVVADPEKMPLSQLDGGGQERRRRAGTENVVGIAGFGAAAEAALRDLDDMPRIRRMRDRLEAGLVDLSGKWGAILHIFGQEAERLPNTSCFAVEGVSAQTALMSLDLDGFAVSSGSACSSGKVGPSHVLKAMGVADAVAACAIRVSLGWTNEEDDIPAFLAAYERILARSVKRAA